MNPRRVFLTGAELSILSALVEDWRDALNELASRARETGGKPEDLADLAVHQDSAAQLARKLTSTLAETTTDNGGRHEGQRAVRHRER